MERFRVRSNPHRCEGTGARVSIIREKASEDRRQIAGTAAARGSPCGRVATPGGAGWWHPGGVWEARSEPPQRAGGRGQPPAVLRGARPAPDGLQGFHRLMKLS